jgi:Mor family transcriptional regulator
MNLIEETIGSDAFRLLREWVGGTDYYVPQKLITEQATVLSMKIGHSAAQKLMEWAGGSRIYVVSSEEHEIEKRRDDIRGMRNRGMTLNEISRIFRFEARYSVKQISRLLSE